MRKMIAVIARYLVSPRPLLLAWMLAIFVASSLPSTRLPEESFSGESYFRHLAAFSVGGVLAGRVFASAHTSLWVLGLFAALDEWHQTFTPGRQADIWDWAADMAGTALGLLLLKWHRTRAVRRAKPEA
jgi:hypothetical protein